MRAYLTNEGVMPLFCPARYVPAITLGLSRCWGTNTRTQDAASM